jgi:hypothetical protein
MRRIVPIALTALILAAPAAAAVTREAKGKLAALSATSVTITGEHASLTCALGERARALAGFSVGDRVVIVCRRTGTGWTLQRIRHLPATVKPVPGTNPPAPVPPSGEGAAKPATVDRRGAIVLLSTTSVTVRGDGELTCTIGEQSPSTAAFHVGDQVKITCAAGTLTEIERLAPPPPAPVPTPAYGAGTIAALSATTITVTGERNLTCTLTDRSPRLGDYHVGDRVKMACTDGVLTAIARVDAPAPAPPAPAPVYAYGTIAALSAGSITVTGEHTLTCTLTDRSPRLGDYHVGDRVKIACTDGALSAIARVV